MERQKFLARLQGKITRRGVIDVLRRGIKYNALSFDLFYGKPSARVVVPDPVFHLAAGAIGVLVEILRVTFAVRDDKARVLSFALNSALRRLGAVTGCFLVMGGNWMVCRN
jgi:hypothetical protein